jgi:hypothetical protein
VTPDAGRLLVVDLSNLCRDDRVAPERFTGETNEALVKSTGIGRLDRFLDGVASARIAVHAVKLVADKSLPMFLERAERHRLHELARDGMLEFSSIADERLLEMAFGTEAASDTLVASMDWFDDFRRIFPVIQGCTNRFLGWEPDDAGGLRVFFRDMGVHTHRRISRREEVAEFKARRLHRESVIRRAISHEFRCIKTSCLLAQLWPERLPELPRYDDRHDRFVCPSCAAPLVVGDELRRSVEVIVLLHDVEQFRLVLIEGTRLVVGRREGTGRVGLADRIPSHAVGAVSRDHLSFQFDGTAVRVQDLNSRNGTMLRDPSGRERRLRAGERQVLGPRATIVLPAGITCELSGRFAPRPGDSQLDVSDGSARSDNRVTRILATKR